MKKKLLTGHLTRPSNRTQHNMGENCRRQPDDDLYFLAQASHKAAKKLAETLQLGVNPLGDFDAYPVLHMYRHAVELFLKAMILGEGGNFLATKPDHISVGKTRSVSWLAQFVCQIITTLKWEDQFRCEGAENLAGFKKLIDDVNSIDLHGMFRDSGDLIMSLPALVNRLDALLDLLDSTADALAAEWDLRNEPDTEEEWSGGDDFTPTIQ